MFRFTIRDVLWLTVVVAMGVGWWLDRSYLASMVDTYDRSFRAMKLLDELNPAWRDDLAGYLKDAPPESVKSAENSK
jgi:hypothetical protein